MEIGYYEHSVRLNKGSKTKCYFNLIIKVLILILKQVFLQQCANIQLV